MVECECEGERVSVCDSVLEGDGRSGEGKTAMMEMVKLERGKQALSTSRMGLVGARAGVL